MFEGARRINLAIFEHEDFASGKQDAVAFTGRSEVDAQTTGHGHRFVPDFGFRAAIRLNIRCFLNERGGLVPRLAILLLHGRDQFIRVRDFRVRCGRQWQQRNCDY